MAPLHPQLPGGRPVLLLPPPPPLPLLLLPLLPVLLLLPPPPPLLTLDASESPGLPSLGSAPHAATSAKERLQTPTP
ncbi:hypothetical protein WMF38_44665 [Sorangium sp. So ce118]